MTQALHQPTAISYSPLVTFTWGDLPFVRRFIRASVAHTIDGESFLPAPELEMRFDKPLSVGTEDSPLILTIRGNREPANTLRMPFPHAPVKVKVEEVDLNYLPSRREIFYGHVSLCDSNPRGGHLLCHLTVDGIKARLTHVVGLQALSTCVWAFGDENNSPCKVTLADKRLTAVLTYRQVDNNPVRVALDTSSDPYFPLTNAHWAGGYIDYQGTKVKIRASLEDGRFDLRSPVSPEWVGKTVTMTPGCDKTIQTCRYWNNETRFMGFGIGMPGANPIFSSRR